MDLVANQPETLETATEGGQEAKKQARTVPEVSQLAAGRLAYITWFVPAHADLLC